MPFKTPTYTVGRHFVWGATARIVEHMLRRLASGVCSKPMERASLRPVPQRPSGPVEPAEAVAHVTATLPALDEAAAQALALVDLVGRTRPQLSAETGIAPDELAEALARARKALRRASFPLPGSGWCERAERLLSDELDGELAEPGPRRLTAHLANCDRCVEHERRLWQARDQLVAGFEEARAPVPAPEPPAVADEPDPEPVEMPDPDPPAALRRRRPSASPSSGWSSPPPRRCRRSRPSPPTRSRRSRCRPSRNPRSPSRFSPSPSPMSRFRRPGARWPERPGPWG